VDIHFEYNGESDIHTDEVEFLGDSGFKEFLEHRLVLEVTELKTRPNGDFYVPRILPRFLPYNNLLDVRPDLIAFSSDQWVDGYVFPINSRIPQAIAETGYIKEIYTDGFGTEHVERLPIDSYSDRWWRILKSLPILEVKLKDRWAKFFYTEDGLPAPNENRFRPWVKDMTHNDKFQCVPFQGVRILREFNISEEDRLKLRTLSIEWSKGVWTVEEMSAKFIRINNRLWDYQYFKKLDTVPGHLFHCHLLLNRAKDGYDLIRSDGPNRQNSRRVFTSDTVFVLNNYKLLLRCFCGVSENRITHILEYAFTSPVSGKEISLDTADRHKQLKLAVIDEDKLAESKKMAILNQRKRPSSTRKKVPKYKGKGFANDETATKAFKDPVTFAKHMAQHTFHEAQGLGDTVSTLFSALKDLKNAYSEGETVNHVAKVVCENGGNELISAIITNYIKSIPDMIMTKIKAFGVSTVGILSYIRDVIKGAFQGLVDIVMGMFKPFFDTASWAKDGWQDFWKRTNDAADEMYANQCGIVMKTVFVVALTMFILFVGHVFKSTVLSPLLFLAITSIEMFAGALNSARTTKLWSRVFPTIGEHEAQMDFGTVRNICTLAIGLVSLRDTMTIVNLMQKMPDVTKSVSSWSCWLVDKCWIFFTDKPFFLDTEQKDELELYCNKLVEFYRNPDNLRLMLTDEPMGRLVRQLGRQAPGWKTALAQLRGIDNKWYNHMNTLMSNIMTHAELVRTTGIAVTQRCEPTVLNLQGMGGQGKGASMQIFPKAVYEVVQKMLPQLYPDPWNPTMVYTKAKNSDFWEGYDQNFCVVHDEMLAVDDPTTRGEQCAEFLNMVDTNPMSLNMAFGAKGQNYFTSPFIIVATNATDKSLRSESGMTAPTSFFRRRHVNVTVSRNEHVEDILQNESYQRAWFYTEYYDPDPANAQHLALQDQTVTLCEHGQLCSKKECSSRHVESYYELLKRKKVQTSNFKEIAHRVAMEIVRKYKTTSSLRQRLATHEFFPEIRPVNEAHGTHPYSYFGLEHNPDKENNRVLYNFPLGTEPVARAPPTVEVKVIDPIVITTPVSNRLDAPETTILPSKFKPVVVTTPVSKRLDAPETTTLGPQSPLFYYDPKKELSQSVAQYFPIVQHEEIDFSRVPIVLDDGSGVGVHIAQGWEDYQAKRNAMIVDDDMRLLVMKQQQDVLLIDVVKNDDLHVSNPGRIGGMLYQWLVPSWFGKVNGPEQVSPYRPAYQACAIMAFGSITQVNEHLLENEYNLNGVSKTDSFPERMMAKIFQMSHNPDYKIRKQVYNFLLELLMLKRIQKFLTKEDFATLKSRAMEDINPITERLFRMLEEYELDSKVVEIFSDQFVVSHFNRLYFDIPYDKPQAFLTSEFGLWHNRFEAVMDKKTGTWNPDLSFNQWRILLKRWKKDIKAKTPSSRSFEIAQWLKKSNSFSDWVSLQTYFTSWKVAGAAVGVLLAAGIAWYFLKNKVLSLTGDVTQLSFVDSEIESKLASHTAQSLSKGFQARLKTRQRVLTHRAQGSEVLNESVMSQINEISNNMRTLTFHYGDREMSIPVFFSGRRAFVYHHCLIVLGFNFDKVTISNDKGVTDVIHSSHIKVTIPSEDKDCVYLDFSHKVFAELPSCKKRFESLENIKSAMASGYYKVSRLHRQVKGGVVVNYLAGGSKLVERELPSLTHLTTVDGKEESLMINDYMYCIGSKGDAGHCSLPYIAVDTVTNNVYVVGFHIGRVGDDSLINVLTENDLPREVAYHTPQGPVLKQGLFMPPHVMNNLSSSRRQDKFNGRLVSMGSLKRPSVIPSETNIIPSPFQGDIETPPIYPISSAPALLKPTYVEQEDGTTVLVQPLVNAVAKVECAPVKIVDPKFVEFIDKEPEAAFCGFFPNVRREFRMLTKQEALQSSDMQASVSYWGKVHGFRKREEMFDKTTGWIHPLLDAAIDKMFEMMDKGYTLKQAMEACLKDETRDLPRVYAGKTRLFYVGCFVHLIVTIMIIGDIINFMKAHRGTSDVNIGINPHGNEWEFLRKKLQSMPDAKFFAGDFSNFDTSIRQVFAYGLFSAFRWYAQWTDEKMNWYLYCITFASVGPLLIITCEVYFMNWANGSGQWLTGVLNSFANVLMSNWFYRCEVSRTMFSSPNFQSYIALINQYLKRGFYGDDNVGAVHPELFGVVTMPKMSKFIYENFGMTYTTPGKSSCTKDYLEWEEIDFLCRRFQRSHGTHAPLLLESIHGMVLWIRKPQRGVSVEQQLAINVEQACMEYYHHGRDVFEKEKLRLWQYSKKYAIPFLAQTWEQYHQRFAEGILMC
jgi:hypothetical protein